VSRVKLRDILRPVPLTVSAETDAATVGRVLRECQASFAVVVDERDGRPIGTVTADRLEHGSGRRTGDLLAGPLVSFIPGADVRTVADHLARTGDRVVTVSDGWRVSGFVTAADVQRALAAAVPAQRSAPAAVLTR
jgi:CBS domain-containing protein